MCAGRLVSSRGVCSVLICNQQQWPRCSCMSHTDHLQDGASNARAGIRDIADSVVVGDGSDKAGLGLTSTAVSRSTFVVALARDGPGAGAAAIDTC